MVTPINHRWSVKRRPGWDHCVDKYNPKAYAVTQGPHPRPSVVKHLFSASFQSGGPRYWAFETEEERDNFVKLFAGAEACGLP